MPKNIERLIKELESDDDDKKKKAIIEISKLKDNTAVKPLLNTLKDNDDDIRMWSAEALGQIGDRSAYVLDALVDTLLDSSEVVRDVAVKAMMKVDPSFSGMNAQQIFQEYRRRYLLEKKFIDDFELETDKFKIIMVGDSEVGKTVFVKRWTLDKFLDAYKMTASANISNKTFHVEGENIEFEIWDLAGQESLLISNYFFGASGALLLFDKNDEETLKSLEDWYTKIRELSGKIPIIVVGNKLDLVEEPSKKGEKFAKKNNMLYIETSVKTGLNVSKTFETLAKVMLEEQDKMQETKEHKKLMKDLNERQQHYYRQFNKFVKNATYFYKIRNFDEALHAYKKAEIFAQKVDFKDGITWIQEQKAYCEHQIKEGLRVKSSYHCQNCDKMFYLVDTPGLECPECQSKKLVKITQLKSLFAPVLGKFPDKAKYSITSTYFEILINMILEERFINAWNFIKFYQKRWNIWQIEVSKINWNAFLLANGIDLLAGYLREVFLFDQANLEIHLIETEATGQTLQMDVTYLFSSKNMQDVRFLFDENKMEYKERIFEQTFFQHALLTVSQYIGKIITLMEFQTKIINSETQEDFEGILVKIRLEISAALLQV